MKNGAQVPTRLTENQHITPPPQAFALQRCACGGTPGIDGECAECRAKRLQRSAAAPEALNQVPSIVGDVLASSGQTLDRKTQAEMGTRFGHDFSQVRVHTDAQAAESAEAVNALAYTVGRNLVFGAGQYAPETSQGQRLLAHELTHVVQQGPAQIASADAGHLSTQRQPNLEAEAHQAAERLSSGNQVPALTHGVGVLIQRWDSPEHVQLGESAAGSSADLITLQAHDQDFPQRHNPMNNWPQEWQRLWNAGTAEQRRAMTQGLTYGEVVALSGDFYETFDALNHASLREIIRLIPLIRGVATTTQLQDATGGRYLALAQRNESHFTNVRPGHRNIDLWRNMHAQAIQAARTGNSNLALGINAAADHYLTDAFSGGHIRTPRAQLMGSAMGNIESKILHDLDNEHGVEVTNARGDTPWIAYGDDMINDPRNARNRALATEAVRLSRQDITDALAQRNGYPTPAPATIFAAEQLVPHPTHPSQDRWTGRIPTYVAGPDGPVRAADDYTTTRDRIIAHEGPGVIAGFFNDDDQIRDWVASQPVAVIGRQPTPEKIRMINTLLSGWISDDDMTAIARICSSVTTSVEGRQIRDDITPQLLDMESIGQRTQMRIILGRLP